IAPFRHELQALAQTVKAKRKDAYEQALAAVDRRLEGALAVVRRFMTPARSFTARAAAEVLKAALGDYVASLDGGHFVRPVEYQDARGFVWVAERMSEGASSELKKADAEALARMRNDLGRLKAAWPTPMPPPTPALAVGELTALIEDLEL